MRIAVDARESGTSTGRYIDKLIEYLHKLKPEHEIIVLTKSARVDFMRQLAPGFRVIESNFKEFTFAEQTGFLNQLNRLNPALVHFGMTQQPVRYGGKKITTVHDLTTVRFINPSKNWLVFKFKQQVYRYVIKSVARTSAKVITPSEYVKTDLAKFAHIAPEKITVTYEAADKITDKPAPVEALAGKQYIMYVGRPTPHKNLLRLVEAFQILRNQNPKLLLALVGKTDANYQNIKHLVEQKGLAGSVIFTGFASEGQLRWLYEHTAAYVFPSLSEGFGLPALEAMAQRAAVVSSSASCLPEIYGEAAQYFDPYDPADMAVKIAAVINDPALRAALVEAGHRQAAKYSWERMAKQTLRLYEACADEED